MQELVNVQLIPDNAVQSKWESHIPDNSYSILLFTSLTRPETNLSRNKFKKYDCIYLIKGTINIYPTCNILIISADFTIWFINHSRWFLRLMINNLSFSILYIKIWPYFVVKDINFILKMLHTIPDQPTMTQKASYEQLYQVYSMNNGADCP